MFVNGDPAASSSRCWGVDRDVTATLNAIDRTHAAVTVAQLGLLDGGAAE